ncbi:helix-turn-helix domain-containing protein [Cryptosporangium sp. NPDC051539]|uniref:helix-turn-helix domain-containing protein n=1 Tax=Cryptosporangium sp. NPDC051539 TaxID=3363962 RepID=UPI003787DE37
MANERLRAALLQHGLTPEDIAAKTGVDPKTVERWVTQGRIPYRRYRYAVAAMLKLDERYLWPDGMTTEQAADASESEIVTVYPHRWAVPRDTWGVLFGAAEREISVFVYSGLFLADDTGMIRLFAAKAEAGVRVRILLGDPDSSHVAQRGVDEGIDESMSARIRNALALYKPLRGRDNVEIGLHDTTLYNSIYRADDDLYVNTHIYGSPAANAPVLHLRKVAGGSMVTTYLESFERVWADARRVD